MNKRFVSYNIHRAIGRDLKPDPQRIAKVLQEMKPDFVALQEISYLPGFGRGMLEEFARAIDAEVIEGITLTDKQGHYGNAVLSRIPVLSVHRHDISFARREPRGAIEIELKINRLKVQVIATHLGLRPAERRAQIKMLLPVVHKSQADVKILLGDFNEWLGWARPLRWLRREYGSMISHVTFPAHRPLLALDRIWVRPAKFLEDIWVHRSPLARVASDHLPLLANLRF
jgi:endonuclease/exonuclease/phosphatase family metal-dependent hydrolase